MVKISNRLMTAAALVTQGYTLADVGTDHGYIPIYLLQQKKIPAAIAMDINEGPLERAKEHIALYGLQAYIQTRLSDGVAALKPGEVEAVLIAGMGGGLIMHILKDGEKVCQSAKELILQPQSEIERVREFLREEDQTSCSIGKGTSQTCDWSGGSSACCFSGCKTWPCGIEGSEPSNRFFPVSWTYRRWENRTFQGVGSGCVWQ